MTDEIGVMSGDSHSLKVPRERIEPYDHSFRSVSDSSKDSDDVLTVMLEARFTRIRVHGETVQFDGFRYFPNIHESPLEAHVDFKDDWGGYIDMDHPAYDMRVKDLHRGLKRRKKIIPLPKEGDPR